MPISTKRIAGRVRQTCKFIKACRGEYGVQMMCRVLGVAPSGCGFRKVWHLISGYSGPFTEGTPV